LKCFNSKIASSFLGVTLTPGFSEKTNLCAWPVPVLLKNGKYKAFDVGIMNPKTEKG